MRRASHILAEKTGMSTPCYTLRGQEKGPTYLITAGVHGNEFASILAAQRLLQLEPRRGTIWLVPIANMEAYRKRTRGKPDLNRSFPYRREEPPRHRMAQELTWLARQVHPERVIDLHEAYGFSQLSPKYLGQSLITNPGSSVVPLVSRIIHEMNRHVDIDKHRFNIRLHELPGSLRTAMNRVMGADTVTVETSVHLPLELRVQYQLQIVKKFLRPLL